jgi:3-dehydroquinate dehydratase type I
MAEIRLDEAHLSAQEIQQIFQQPVKLIATCRPGQYNESERAVFLHQAIEAGAAYVDLELESSDDFKTELREHARRKACQLIISYHNYKKTPPRGELEQILDWCFDSKADIAKIVCQSHGRCDNARIFALYSDPRPLVAFGMGQLGRYTRVMALLLGAPFIYAALEPGKETADGQFDHRHLTKILGYFERD